jgi:hypothetical protein
MGVRRHVFAAATALATPLLGSALILAASDDPLVFDGREAEVMERTAAVARREAIDFGATDLRISPSGTRWALRRVDAGARGESWVIGDFTGARVDVAASDLAFLDERRVLALGGFERREDGETGPDATATPELRLYDLGEAPRAVAVSALPRLDSARLDVESASGRYRVTGIDYKSRELVRISGRAGSDERAETRWASPPSKSGVPLSSWSVGDDDVAVDVERLLEPRTAISLRADTTTPWHSEIWRLRSGGGRQRLASTSLAVRCLPALAPRATCLAVTPDATYFWSVDPRRDALAPLASLRGRAREEAIAPDGRIAVWLAGPGLTLVDAPARRAERMKLPVDRAWGLSLAATKEHVGVLVQGSGGSAVLLVAR